MINKENCVKGSRYPSNIVDIGVFLYTRFSISKQYSGYRAFLHIKVLNINNYKHIYKR